MAYDEGPAQRVREALEEQTNVTEKKMLGAWRSCWVATGASESWARS